MLPSVLLTKGKAPSKATTYASLEAALLVALAVMQER
jgi:hypothetical protein